MGEYGRRTELAIKSQLGLSNLTATRERTLLVQYQSAETETARQAALTELWESHSKLVVAIAHRYRRNGIELVDLIGAGHLGLHTAISRFDINLTDVRLSSFATPWIRGAIADHIRRNSTVMRLPESNTHRQLFFLREKLISDARLACIRDGVDATDAEIHERVGSRIGMTAPEVANSLRFLNGGVLSLDCEPENGVSSWQDTLTDDSAITEDDVIRRLDRAKARRRVLELSEDILGERERAVFLARCSINGDEPVTLEVLAERFGVSRERIHQLEASARRKIATALTNEGYARVGATKTEPERVPSRKPASLLANRPVTRLSA